MLREGNDFDILKPGKSSLFSGIGGAMGLVLGLSLFNIVEAVLKICKNAMGQARFWLILVASNLRPKVCILLFAIPNVSFSAFPNAHKTCNKKMFATKEEFRNQSMYKYYWRGPPVLMMSSKFHNWSSAIKLNSFLYDFIYNFTIHAIK